MRKYLLFSLLFLASLNLFAHAGEVHKYMGTVTAVNSDGSFAIETKEGKTIQVAVSAATLFRHADGTSAPKSDLVTGKRAVVTISKDGKTASEVKLAAAKK